MPDKSLTDAPTHDTLARGSVETVSLKHDKAGPYLDVRLRLTWVDDFATFARQTTRTVAVTFTTQEDPQQLPLFEAP